MNDLLQTLLHPTPTLLMMQIVVGLLLASTIAVTALPRFRPAAPMAELQARLKSWWIMVAVFLIAISVDARLSMVFTAMLSYLALKEFFTLVHLRLADRRAILLCYLAILVQYWWVYTQWYGMFLVFIPVFMLMIIPFRLVLAGDTERFVTSLGKLHWGLMAFVFGLSHLAYLLVLDVGDQPIDTRALVFYVVFLAEFNDVLQYLFGKSFGRHKLAPSISPNKTWEGLIGGVIGTAVLAVLLRFLTPMDWRHALGAGLLIGIIGPIGGLVMSAIKRDVGVKDSGTMIPGHGGILDRVDSLCFSVPIFFHYFRYFHLA